MSDISFLSQLVTQSRRDILRMVHKAKSGHPGGSLGCVEFFIALYYTALEIDDKFSLDGINEDVFFLSNGHISPVFYSVLARKGFFPVYELNTFRNINSRLQGHPSVQKSLPGVRVASGSLGQGLSVAVGAALAKKLNNDSKISYALLGDGELQEGQNWEAFMYAGSNNLDNLIVTIDLNGQQIDGSTKDVLSLGDIEAKLKAFDWEVIVEKEGNNLEKVISVLKLAKTMTKNKKPICILLHTIMGNGVDFMMHTHDWHGIAPNDEQLDLALSQNPETLKDF